MSKFIWRFPKIGVPLSHPFFRWDVPWHKLTSDQGVPPWRAGKPPCTNHSTHVAIGLGTISTAQVLGMRLVHLADFPPSPGKMPSNWQMVGTCMKNGWCNQWENGKPLEADEGDFIQWYPMDWKEHDIWWSSYQHLMTSLVSKIFYQGTAKESHAVHLGFHHKRTAFPEKSSIFGMSPGNTPPFIMDFPQISNNFPFFFPEKLGRSLVPPLSRRTCIEVRLPPDQLCLPPAGHLAPGSTIAGSLHRWTLSHKTYVRKGIKVL